MKILTIKSLMSCSIVFALFLISVGCSSSKTIQAPQKVIQPSEEEIVIKQYCSGQEYQSSEGFIRARSFGESVDMLMSSKVAKSNTLGILASQIEVGVKGVIDDYYNRKQKNLNENITVRYEEMIRQVVNQKIRGYKVICDKVTKTKQNKYRTYYVYELPVDNVLDEVYNKISKDEELKIDYDYQKFKKTFEEEMMKIENQ